MDEFNQPAVISHSYINAEKMIKSFQITLFAFFFFVMINKIKEDQLNDSAISESKTILRTFIIIFQFEIILTSNSPFW